MFLLQSIFALKLDLRYRVCVDLSHLLELNVRELFV